jgi:hypothetical protein
VPERGEPTTKISRVSRRREGRERLRRATRAALVPYNAAALAAPEMSIRPPMGGDYA